MNFRRKFTCDGLFTIPELVILSAAKNLCDTPMAFRSKTFHMYIMASASHRIYVGMTNNLLRRVWEHKQGAVEGFTKRYNMTRLVYFEEAPDALSAIRREKQIKGWLRSKKITLIQAMNPRWDDLAAEWFDKETH